MEEYLIAESNRRLSSSASVGSRRRKEIKDAGLFRSSRVPTDCCRLFRFCVVSSVSSPLISPPVLNGASFRQTSSDVPAGKETNVRRQHYSQFTSPDWCVLFSIRVVGSMSFPSSLPPSLFPSLPRWRHRRRTPERRAGSTSTADRITGRGSCPLLRSQGSGTRDSDPCWSSEPRFRVRTAFQHSSRM